MQNWTLVCLGKNRSQKDHGVNSRSKFGSALKHLVEEKAEFFMDKIEIRR
jgi:hypothetical protein